MGFPDRIERTISVAQPPEKVWAAITTAEGLGTWFGQKATVDLRVGGVAQLTWDGELHPRAAHRAAGAAAGVRLDLGHLAACPRTTRAGPTSSSRWSRTPRAPG